MVNITTNKNIMHIIDYDDVTDNETGVEITEEEA